MIVSIRQVKDIQPTNIEFVQIRLLNSNEFLVVLNLIIDVPSSAILISFLSNLTLYM